MDVDTYPTDAPQQPHWCVGRMLCSQPPQLAAARDTSAPSALPALVAVPGSVIVAELAGPTTRHGMVLSRVPRPTSWIHGVGHSVAHHRRPAGVSTALFLFVLWRDTLCTSR